MGPGSLARCLRRRAGLTQQQLAVRARTTKTAISRLEHGHVSPTVETLERLLRYMGSELRIDAVAMVADADPSQLDVVADLSPTQRLDHALTSQATIADLLGAARGR